MDRSLNRRKPLLLDRPSVRRAGGLVLLAAATLATWLSVAHAAEPKKLHIDCGTVVGKIRPLHGVNGGVLNRGETIDLSAHWRELGIPLTRLHDCEWPAPSIVDMHAVFPRLDADPRRPDSYHFARTDDYLQAIANAGVGMVYRLGESIEHSARKHRVAPPADYDKWTAACLGIIRHYNEGWADGFHHRIRYWEIWNEPENRPAMWTGTDEDYFRLYAIAAKAIKAHDATLLVGGPGVGATGEVVGGNWRPTEFLRGFLRHCREESLPLDFFSWHTYCDDPQIYVHKARAIRRWLDEHGFRQTELHLNEWNYLPDNDWSALTPAGQGAVRRRWYERMGGPEGAAFIACTLLELQDSPVDVANLFTGDTGEFGLFDRYGDPKTTFYAVKAFRMLLDTPLRIAAEGGQPGKIALCAGMNDGRHAVTIVLSNYRATEEAFDLVVEHLPWQGATTSQLFRVDAQHRLESGAQQHSSDSLVRLAVRLPAPGIVLIRLTAATKQALQD